jgi:multiple sugar transport system substrate-binding protein
VSLVRSRSGPRRLAALASVALIATACGSSTPSASTAASAGASPAASTSAAASASASASAAPSPSPSLVQITPEPVGETGPNGGKPVSWFIGLGAGAQPQQIKAEQDFAKAYNASQSEIYLTLEILDNKIASNILQTRIAAGNPPDIIGPVGVEGLNIFRDQLLDLAPLVQAQGFDTTNIDPKLVDFWKMGEGGAMIGVPYAIYPSWLWYSKDLFDEAHLAYPPSKIGDMYEGKPWDMAALRDLAMKLTVDSNGADATSSDFDPTKVEQWGFDMQYTNSSPVAESTLFGASSVVAADGHTAQIPDPLKTGIQWYYDGVWKDHFIPNNNHINSDLLSKGSEFASGNLAMMEGHSWFTCCVWPAAPAKPVVQQFGWAAPPSYNGTVTAKLHADTFSIMKGSKDHELAFKALMALVASPELLTNYGAFAADTTKQQPFIDSINKQFAGITLDWSVPQETLGHPDIPNHQAWMPDYAKSAEALRAFWTKYRTTDGLDLSAEEATLKTTLQGIFDAAD